MAEHRAHSRLPTDTRLFTGHDYRPNGREARWESTIACQKACNLHLKNCDEAKFVESAQIGIKTFQCRI